MKFSKIGGQAVIEGIMMRNGDKYSVAVRKPDKEIEIMTKGCGNPDDFWHKCPIIRGVVSFWESLSMGMTTLTYSASFFEEEAPKKELTKEEEAAKKKKENLELTITMIFAIVMAFLLFFCLPYFVSSLIKKYLFADNYTLFALVEGVFRMSIFLLYIWLISFMEDIKRLFMYHGAEHKCINCVENGLPLTVENVRKSSRYHKRCGTSFIFIVFMLSILVFMFIRIDNNIAQMVCRLAFVPVIAGVSYEFIRLAGRSQNCIVGLLSKPGMFIQKLTTREPEDDMIEVGIKAVEAVFDWKKFLKDEFGVEYTEVSADTQKAVEGQ